MKTDEELKQIAIDFKAGRIFSTQHKPLNENLKDIMYVFMPLAFMTPQQHEALAAENPVVMYEYLDQASPRGFNGMPSFFSFQHLNSDEWNKVVDYHKKLDAAEESL